MKYIYQYCLLLTMLGLSACLRDDYDDCPVLLHLYFESVMKKYEYEPVTDRLDLYVYNSSGLKAGHYSYSKNELESINYSPTIELKSNDQYTIEAVVNLSGFYEVSGQERLERFRLSLNADPDGTVNERQNDLYQGWKPIDIPYHDGKTNVHLYDTIPLYKNTNHIEVNVVRGKGLPSGHTLHAYINGNNGVTDYLVKSPGGDWRHYLPYEKNETTPQWKFLFTIMRLWIGSDLMLHVEERDENGDVVITKELNLVAEISKLEIYNTDEKLEQEDCFVISLILTDNYTIFELKINNWYLIKQGVSI